MNTTPPPPKLAGSLRHVMVMPTTWNDGETLKLLENKAENRASMFLSSVCVGGGGEENEEWAKQCSE